MKLCEGNVLTDVCHSVHRGWVSLVPCPFWEWVSLVTGPFKRVGMFGGWVCPRGLICPGGGYAPPKHETSGVPLETWYTMGYSWQAGSTHLTGMLSCYKCFHYLHFPPTPATHISEWRDYVKEII